MPILLPRRDSVSSTRRLFARLDEPDVYASRLPVLSQRRLSTSGSYISLCAMIIVIAVWSIGFGFSYVDMIALVVALASSSAIRFGMAILIS